MNPSETIDLALSKGRHFFTFSLEEGRWDLLRVCILQGMEVFVQEGSYNHPLKEESIPTNCRELYFSAFLEEWMLKSKSRYFPGGKGSGSGFGLMNPSFLRTGFPIGDGVSGNYPLVEPLFPEITVSL